MKAHAQRPSAPQNDAAARDGRPATRAVPDRAASETRRVATEGRAAPPTSAASFGHDLTRVPVVSTATPLKLQAKLSAGAPGDAFEREADRTAELVMSAPPLAQAPHTPYRLSNVGATHAGRVIQRAAAESVRVEARGRDSAPDAAAKKDAGGTETTGVGANGPSGEGGCWEPGRELAPDEVHAACLAADNNKPCPDAPQKSVNQFKFAAAPNDPISLAENAAANAEVAGFGRWKDYEYDLIVVPGFTPLDAEVAYRMRPEEKSRLTRAQKDFAGGEPPGAKAPFIFVSGGAVYPYGTPCYEGVEMKHELIDMGVPVNRIIVDAAAQHSTSNIRNAGRYMLARNQPLTRALIVTTGAQDFYFSHPERAGFHARTEKELGYRIGELKNVRGRGHSAYTPSENVKGEGLDPQDL